MRRKGPDGGGGMAPTVEGKCPGGGGGALADIGGGRENLGDLPVGNRACGGVTEFQCHNY